MKKLLIMSLAFALILTLSLAVSADYKDGEDFDDQPWYTWTADYFGNVPYFNVNAEIIQEGDYDLAEINQNGYNFAHIGQGVDFQPSLTNSPVYANSSYNAAYIDQDGYRNEGEVNQRGTENFADIEQKGEFNYAGAGQSGDDMFAEIKQDADRSFVRASQWGGEGSSAYITQEGYLNRIRTRQSGDFHTVSVDQLGGELNYVLVEQFDLEQTAAVTQDGDHNGVFVEQRGFMNDAEVDQVGDYNDAEIHQDALGLSALIMQNGDSNLGIINQTGGGI